MAGRDRIRTDLALEATERFKEENVEVHGVEVREKYDKEKDVRTTVVRITTEMVRRQWESPRERILPSRLRIFPCRMRIITGRFQRR